MLSIEISQDIEEIKDDFFLGFSFRETMYFGASMISILIVITLCTFIGNLNIMISTWIGMPIAFVICANGFFSRDKMTVIEFMKKKLLILFLKPLKYISTENDTTGFIETKNNATERKRRRKEKQIGSIQISKKNNSTDL